MRIRDGRRLVTLAACCAPLTYLACSTFSTDEAPPAGADSAVPAVEPRDDAAADAAADTNTVTNLGCPGHTTVVDFSKPVELGNFFPSTDGGLTLSSDDAGTFGRVQVALTSTLKVVKLTYTAPVPQAKLRSVCFSARIRTPSAPRTSDLGVFGMFRRDKVNANLYGYASLLLGGSQQNLLVAYIPADGGQIVTGGLARIQLAESAFRLVRLDAHASDGGPWTATMALDGTPQVVDAPVSPPQTQTGSLELWFGIDVGQAGNEAVVVDFADVRLDLD
jgi:hypothetical protein